MKLYYWPGAMLKRVSETVTEPVDPKFLDEMYTTMKSYGGVGLSAIQVGVPKRIIVIDVGMGRQEFINAEVTDRRGDFVPLLEGCLSIPGFFEIVKRYTAITVKYQDRDLNPKELVINGGLQTQLAQCLQHEIEHAQGLLFVEKLPAATRSTIMGNMIKLRKAGKLR